MTSSLRPRLLGFLIGLPFAAAAWAIAQTLLGGSTYLGARFEAFGPLLAVGPAVGPAAAIGVLVASTIVAPRLAQPWSDRLASAVWFLVVGHLVAAVATVVLIVTSGAGDVSRAGEALVMLIATFVGTIWAWAVGAGIWVAVAGKVLRRDAPATAEESAESLDLLARQTRHHVHLDATIPGDQGAKYRQAR